MYVAAKIIKKGTFTRKSEMEEKKVELRDGFEV